ncbi:jg6572 [Pararge aegeria aegeria]|uniref:Jg6572 protein n=1 Tax=Pararge aegeria aegeria TaxID=348720 RepID=A0A8S4R960_9NEOP|nr:jg6572 [Pararge aegeria aegeria]
MKNPLSLKREVTVCVIAWGEGAGDATSPDKSINGPDKGTACHVTAGSAPTPPASAIANIATRLGRVDNT